MLLRLYHINAGCKVWSELIDRLAYAELNLPMPKLIAWHMLGRAPPRTSICDTGVQLTVIPHSLVNQMCVKFDSM